MKHLGFYLAYIKQAPNNLLWIHMYLKHSWTKLIESLSTMKNMWYLIPSIISAPTTIH